MLCLNDESNRIFLRLIANVTPDSSAVIIKPRLKKLTIDLLGEYPNTPYGDVELYRFCLGGRKSKTESNRFFFIDNRAASKTENVTIVPHHIWRRQSGSIILAEFNARKELDVVHLSQEHLDYLNEWFSDLFEDGYLDDSPLPNR
jgi:hypothetical protein